MTEKIWPPKQIAGKNTSIENIRARESVGNFVFLGTVWTGVIAANVAITLPLALILPSSPDALIRMSTGAIITTIVVASMVFVLNYKLVPILQDYNRISSLLEERSMIKDPGFQNG